MNRFEAATLLAEQATTPEVPIKAHGDEVRYNNESVAQVQLTRQSWLNRDKPRKLYISVGPYGERRTFKLSEKTGRWTPGAVAAVRKYAQQVKKKSDRHQLEREAREATAYELKRLGCKYHWRGPIRPGSMEQEDGEIIPAIELEVTVPLELLPQALELLGAAGLYEPEPTSQIEDSRDSAEAPAVQ